MKKPATSGGHQQARRKSRASGREALFWAVSAEMRAAEVEKYLTRRKKYVNISPALLRYAAGKTF
jgi:hypothetical protein